MQTLFSFEDFFSVSGITQLLSSSVRLICCHFHFCFPLAFTQAGRLWGCPASVGLCQHGADPTLLLPSPCESEKFPPGQGKTFLPLATVSTILSVVGPGCRNKLICRPGWVDTQTLSWAEHVLKFLPHSSNYVCRS